jgi:hypothetical protein
MNYQQSAPIPVMPDVPSRADALAKSLGNLSDVVSVLEKKLEVVMRQSGPTNDTNTKDQSTPLCLMAENFYQCQRLVENESCRVQSLINRLEI